MRIDAIKAFHDNYLWAYHPLPGHCILVDPGDAAPLLAYLKSEALQLQAIWITHHHADHQGGTSELLKHFDVPVYGPANEAINHRTHAMQAGDTPMLGWTVLDVGGHTAGHIAYYHAEAGVLFCGDTMFAGGCGRVFDGTYAQLHDSLERIAALPKHTRIYCAHEYTQSNLAFAQKVEPHNSSLFERVELVAQLRTQGQATVPSTLEVELATNPFIRTQVPEVKAAAELFAGKKLASASEVFTALRQWKNMG